MINMQIVQLKKTINDDINYIKIVYEKKATVEQIK